MMSGTSLDGVDVCIAEFRSENGRDTFTVLHEHTRPFTRQEYQFFKNLIDREQPISIVCDANILLMSLYADTLRKAVDSHSDIQIDAIGIHGQTVWHSPQIHNVCGKNLRSTLQLASPSALAVEFGVPVVSDFRSADVALGGQGAPLIPMFDFSFLRSETQHVTALNIGGMANVTFIPPHSSHNDVIAFDTGPGNVWIDAAMLHYYGKRYDENGATARAGRIIQPMFNELQELGFVAAPPPKSTGREMFAQDYLEDVLRRHVRHFLPPEDAIATLTAFTAYSIAENVRRFGTPTTTLVASGGGVHNRYLIELLIQELPSAAYLPITSFGVSADAKESLCFGYLAYRTLGGRMSNIPSVTGASRPTILGSITLP